MGARVVAAAHRYKGIDYAYGGTNPRVGLDCSGLVRNVLRDVGIHAPRTSAAQAAWATPITRSQLRPGDLVFGVYPSGRVHHVGIYIGDGRMIDAPTEGESVGVHKLYKDMTRFGRIPA